MKRIEITGMCLIVALAGGLVTAGTAMAQATPEYRQCVKLEKDPATHKYTGRYEDADCARLSGAGEGKYEAESLPVPYEFFTTVKGGAVMYYHTSAGSILWQVRCKGGTESGVITSTTEGTEDLTLESCRASDPATPEAKPLSCPVVTVMVESVLANVAPETKPGIVLYPGFAKTFTCTRELPKEEGALSSAFGPSTGEEAGTIENQGKGPLGVLAVNPATGAQTTTGFYLEGTLYSASLLSTVSGSPTLQVGIASSLPLQGKPEGGRPQVIVTG